MRIPRVVIAAPHSGAGKTTVAVGLMSVFTSRGLRVQPFKVGPDFIDPSYHTRAAGIYSKNLDTWLTSAETAKKVFVKSCRKCDLAIIEGVMGLFDGVSGSEDAASTAEISRILNAPIILVVDASRTAGSSGALVHGFKTFDQRVKIKGVILNHVKSQKHIDLTRQAIERGAGVPVIGALPSTPGIVMPSRHLGLIPAPERNGLADFLTELRRFINQYLDLEQVLEIARSADDLETEEKEDSSQPVGVKARVGIACDEAFNFYYRDNIELLEANGAEVVPFSPMHDSSLPSNLHGMFLGGGFPEAYAKQLEENQLMRESIKKAVEDEMPVYAECGGLMYLVQSTQDLEACPHRMIGILSGRAIMGGKLESLNYSVAHVIRKNILSDVGFTLRGHEFHYSKIEDVPTDAKFAYEMKIGKGISGQYDGWLQHNLLASYLHIHFAYDLHIAKNFVDACQRYGQT
ncbi:MAG TPA: cobyrinate a,c-diamide synthase [Candidatus Dormibacteraeota bacterium]|nr:cobyrinate a,c-diamide synthase [Candidatus Dormibacteraeota bacterium]